jgi:hypothetical protein
LLGNHPYYYPLTVTDHASRFLLTCGALSSTKEDYAHVSHLFSEVIAKDPIAVPQQVTQELVKGKCLPQLLSRPLRGRVGGHIEVQDATPVMGQHRKHVSTRR